MVSWPTGKTCFCVAGTIFFYFIFLFFLDNVDDDYCILWF